MFWLDQLYEWHLWTWGKEEEEENTIREWLWIKIATVDTNACKSYKCSCPDGGWAEGFRVWKGGIDWRQHAIEVVRTCLVFKPLR